MRQYLIITTAALLFAACASQKKTVTKTASPAQFRVKGTIDTTAGTVFYTSYRRADSMITDSFKLGADKKFTLNGNIQDPVLLSIRADRKVMIDGPSGFSVWVEPGKTISLSVKKGATEPEVKGSALQDEYSAYTAQAAGPDAAMKQLYKDAAEAQKNGTVKTVEASLDRRYDSIQTAQKQMTATFVEKHPASYLSLYLMARMMLYKPDVAKVSGLYNSFSAGVKNTVLGKQVAEALEIEKRLAIGSAAPDFTQNDSTGKAVKLSSLKGKVVLVDFWASWCGPCRAENPNVVKAYQQYHPKGFEILGVSLDNKQPNWLKAIQDDKLAWLHVSDLKGWKNAVAEQYHIRSIPDNFLLDKNGKIIARGLRGEELEKKLAELM